MKDIKVKAPVGLKIVTVFFLILSVISFVWLFFVKITDYIEPESKVKHIFDVGVVSLSDTTDTGFYTKNNMFIISKEDNYSDKDIVIISEKTSDLSIGLVSRTDGNIVYTKDYNNQEKVSSKYDIEGKIVTSIPYLGYLSLLSEGIIGYVILGAIPLTILILLFLIMHIIKASKRKAIIKKEEEEENFVKKPYRKEPFSDPQRKEAVTPPVVNVKTVPSVIKEEIKENKSSEIIFIKDGDMSSLSEDDKSLVEKVNGTNVAFKTADEIIKLYREEKKAQKEKETKPESDINAKLYYDNDIESYK